MGSGRGGRWIIGHWDSRWNLICPRQCKSSFSFSSPKHKITFTAYRHHSSCYKNQPWKMRILSSMMWMPMKWHWFSECFFFNSFLQRCILIGLGVMELLREGMAFLSEALSLLEQFMFVMALDMWSYHLLNTPHVWHCCPLAGWRNETSLPRLPEG